MPETPIRRRRMMTAFKYIVLFTPMAVMLGSFGFIAAGAWVAAILRGSFPYVDAPTVIQKLAHVPYYRTRVDWVALPDCAMFDRELLYKPRPGTCEFRNVEFTTTLHFDEHGFRRTAAPRTADHAVSRPRLVMIGDSHTMGWGVQDEETFASLLASEKGYPTVNLGAGSYGTPRELRRLELDANLRPDDVVVLQYCDNDLAENRRFLATGRVGPYELSEFQQFIGAYRPTPAETWPVSALLARSLWRGVMNQAPQEMGIHRATEAEKQVTADPATVFLEVLKKFPVLQGHRVVLVVINAELTSHLLPGRDRIEKAGITFVVPPLTRDVFFNLDDHMRPPGHHIVASAIATALEQGSAAAAR
jgi:hypothetical protein